MEQFFSGSLLYGLIISTPLIAYEIFLIVKFVRSRTGLPSGKSILQTNLSEREDAKNKFLQLLQSQKSVDIYKACSVMNTVPNDFRQKVNALVQEGKVMAEFKGDELIVSSGIEEFVRLINESFTAWSTTQKPTKAPRTEVDKSRLLPMIIIAVIIVVVFIIAGVLSSPISLFSPYGM